MTKKSWQKVKYLENEKSFWDGIKSTLSEVNKTNLESDFKQKNYLACNFAKIKKLCETCNDFGDVERNPTFIWKILKDASLKALLKIKS